MHHSSLARRGLLVALLAVALALTGVAVAQPDKGKSDAAKKKGSLVGVVTAKGPIWIEVKADGEEKGRRYTPHWRGGLPKDGGGLDKEMLETFSKLKVGTRIRLAWEFQERPRAVKIEVLREPKDK
ncbi:MAG: hypothetical protein U0736_24355 [Gemmataceae bacterium]